MSHVSFVVITQMVEISRKMIFVNVSHLTVTVTVSDTYHYLRHPFLSHAVATRELHNVMLN
jgi:hypothetical protein